MELKACMSVCRLVGLCAYYNELKEA